MPKQERAHRTKESIIRAATRVIESDGLARLSTNVIARRAGLGVASVYEYFEDKDEVVVAVLEREMAELWSRLETRIPKLLADDLDAVLRELFSFVLGEVTHRSNLVRAAASHVHGATTLPAGVRFLGQIEMLFRLLLQRFGKGSPRDAQLGAYLVTQALLGICTGVAVGLPPGATTDDVVDWLVRVARGVFDR